MKPRVYLCGPITGLSYCDSTDWRDYAICRLGENGMEGVSPLRGKEYLAGLSTISGHGRDYAHLGPLSTPRGVMTRDRFDATHCDAVLANLLYATHVSIGSVMELAWADAHRIPIVAVMGDATPIVDVAHRGWLAALIDGEGCIGMSRRPTKVGYSYQAMVRVKMASEAVVRAAHARCGLGSLRGPLTQNVPNRRPYWEWTVMAQQAANLLRELYPYLIEKKPQAALAIELQGCNGGLGSRTATDDVHQKRASIFERHRLAQQGQSVEFSEPAPSRASVHMHMMVEEAVGFRTGDLDEAIDILACLLRPYR